MQFSTTLRRIRNCQRFERQFGVRANQFVYQGYLTGRVLREALLAVNGVIEETSWFLEALRGVHFVGLTGNFRFHSESQGAVITVFIRRVEQLRSRELGNIVLDQIPDIDDLSHSYS